MPKRRRAAEAAPATAAVGEMSFDALLANQDALADAELQRSAPAPARASKSARKQKARVSWGDGAGGGGEEPADAEEDDVAVHRAELAALKAKDPAFYAHLKKSAAGLLGFGEGEDEEGGEDAAEGAGLDGRGAAGEEEEEDGGGGGRVLPLLTQELAASILSAAFDGESFKGLQRAVQAFRACVHMGESADMLDALGLDEGGDAADAAKRRRAKRAKAGSKAALDRSTAPAKAVVVRFRVTHPAVFMQVVTAVLQRCGPTLARHLGRGGSDGALPPRTVLAECPGWARIEGAARGLLSCTLHLLGTARDPALCIFTLRAMRALVPYLQAFPALERKAVKALAALWAQPRGENDGLRLVAYLRLRQVAQSLPYPAIDGVLKAVYSAYARTARAVNETTAPGHTLMVACVSELFGVDEASSYAHAFTHLRELAVLLRGALTSNGDEEAVSAVLSWQVVNCLRAWTAVLCSHAPDSGRPLHQLVYPLVQVILGVLRLAQAPRFHPLRLHACAMLVELQWATGVYIPVALPLLDILRCPALQRKPRGSAPSNPPALALMVRVSPSTAETKAYQDALVSRTLELLLDAMRSQFHSPALPELVAPVIIQLKAFASASRVPPWKARSKALVDALLAQAQAVSVKRAAAGFAPSDRAAVAAFMAAEARTLRASRARARNDASAAVLAAAQASAAAVAPAAQQSAGGSSEDEESDDGMEEGAEGDGIEEGEGDDDDDEMEEEEAPAVKVRTGKGGRRQQQSRRPAAAKGAWSAPAMRDTVADISSWDD